MSIYQCSLPREIVVILFQTFFIRFLVGYVSTNKKIQTHFQARLFLSNRTEKRWTAINKVLSSITVLLNRAPTLHRFGFQSFKPKLTYNYTVKIHPAVCIGFNADFDGDQIAIHVLLSVYSRSEALSLITPGSHFFSPATGEPTFIPRQEIVLGIYYITAKEFFFSQIMYFIFFKGIRPFIEVLLKIKTKHCVLFSEPNDAIKRFEKGKINLHHNICLYIRESDIMDSKYNYDPYDIRFKSNGIYQKNSFFGCEIKNTFFNIFSTIIGRVIFSCLWNYLPS